MCVVFGLLLSLALQVITSKVDHKGSRRLVPRFKIPGLKHEAEFPPEKISIVSKRRLLDATELPGAYGGDLLLPNLMARGDSSDDSESSGSGNGRDDIAYFKHLVRKHIADISSRSDDDVERHGMTYQHHTRKVSGGKGRSKIKSTKKPSKELITKIDDIAKQIAKVQNKENIDRKEEAKLKVQKDVARKVIKSIKEKHVHKGVVRGGKEASKKEASKNEAREKEANEKEAEVKNVTSVEAVPNEGFECPWVCFWTCHSYCPQECCHNPYHCSGTCREICSPYCNDRCCAPGSQRLPKLKLSFRYGVEERSNVKNTTTKQENAKIAAAKMAEKEKAFQLEKQRQQKLAFAVQMDAIRKASSYAARLIGLPETCPLTCARICLPSICKHECCARRSNITEYHIPSQYAARYAGYPSTAQFRSALQQQAYPVKVAPNAMVRAFHPPSYVVHECPPVCRSVCVPQCPNQCCHNLRSRFDYVKPRLG